MYLTRRPWMSLLLHVRTVESQLTSSQRSEPEVPPSYPFDHHASYDIRSLAATGRYKLRGLVRSLEKAQGALGETKGLELAEGNILDETSLGNAMKVTIRG